MKPSTSAGGGPGGVVGGAGGEDADVVPDVVLEVGLLGGSGGVIGARALNGRLSMVGRVAGSPGVSPAGGAPVLPSRMMWESSGGGL